ncbi:MAG: hypothetical protein Q8K93_19050 [Reyranella sp.]|nr:hypothetical protein [Reyranella sp.]
MPAGEDDGHIVAEDRAPSRQSLKQFVGGLAFLKERPWSISSHQFALVDGADPASAGRSMMLVTTIIGLRRGTGTWRCLMLAVYRSRAGSEQFGL